MIFRPFGAKRNKKKLELEMTLADPPPSPPSMEFSIIDFFFEPFPNELGKVTTFWTSRPLFSWRNSHLKKVRADSAPALIGLRQFINLDYGEGFRTLP